MITKRRNTMKAIQGAAKTALMLALLAAMGAGCARDRTYADDRPPVDQLADGNTGLQAKDVVAATDHMAIDLLALPELNAADHQWTIVITRVDNHTTDPTLNYDTFSQRLRANLARLGRGRVALIENRAKYKQLQSEELEPGATDDYGQGGGKTSPGAPGQNPDYGLYITIDELPNRATSYFQVTATLTNLSTRVEVWNNQYEVQTAR
jgi:hypothetical protein